MNCDLDEQHQQHTNHADSEEDTQEDSHFIIDYEQLKHDIAFYLLILIQIAFVFITKWVINDEIVTNSSNQNTSNATQNGQSNSSSSSSTSSGNNKYLIIWSALNIFILVISASAFIYTIIIYRKVMKRQYYQFQAALNYFFIAFLASYVFSKPSPNQNILFIQYQEPSEKVYEGQSNNKYTEMYDLYFVLMLSNKIYIRTTTTTSLGLKIILHIVILVISLQKTSPQGYIPLAICAAQFVVADVIQFLFICYQNATQVLCCSCSSLKCFYSTDNLQQQQLSPGKQNKSQNSVFQQYYTTHQTNLDGTLCNDQIALKNNHIAQSHSYYLKTYNNLSKDGLIGKRSQQIHKFLSSRNGVDIQRDSQKKGKKMNLNSINSFWNISKKDQSKQSGEIQYIKEAEEKWQQYLNEIPSGIILIKKNLNQVKFANEFIRQFFLRNFRKFNEGEILNMVLREIEFKVLSHIVNHTSNEKKRITRFSSSAKKQVRESISNAEKKSGKRSSNINNINNLQHTTNNGGDTKNSTGNHSLFQFTMKNNYENDQNSQKSPLTQPLPINQTYSNITPSNQLQKQESEKTTTLEAILTNFDQNHSSYKDIENSTIEIYTKVLNVENKESISIKGKVLYRSEGDEFMIILEDYTKFENVTNLADRDDYKNRLISSFSHELRTPLNSSMGFLQSALLDDSIMKVNKDIYLLPAYQALKLQYFFINDILDFSQILAKKDLQLNFVKFNITKLVCDIRELYDNSFTQKGITLNFTLDNKIQNWEICTDYDRLMQVLVNLINNSLRFTLKGGVTVKIIPTLQNNLCIHVIDTGEGMNMLQFEQIKQKLSQFGMTGIPITETQHTGFGLTISQIIVSILATEQSQDLELKKTNGGGCTFSFCIENILNLQTSYSMTSHNNSRLDVMKSGTKVFTRKDIRKQTYAHKALEKPFAKTLQFSSHSLYTKHAKELKRGSSASISRIEDLKAPITGSFKAQASVFKKSVIPQQLESSDPDIQNNEQKNRMTNQIKMSFELNNGLINELPEKMDRKNSINNKLILSEIYKQQNESDPIQNFQQIKTQPLFSIATPTNNIDDFMQTSNYNLYNNQNSSYSQQKRFFATQSQAILTSHNNLIKEKSFKYQEQVQEDMNKSLLQNDSMISHNECFENKLHQYNFNSLIHSNQAIFTSPIRKFTNINIFDSVIENNSVENIPQQDHAANDQLTDLNLFTPTIKASVNLSERMVDNASTSAQIQNQEKSLLECIEVQTPHYLNHQYGDVEDTQGQQNGIPKKFNFKINLQNSTPLIHNDYKRNSNNPIKTIIVTPGSKKVTPNKQNNNVKFCFQLESKTTSDKDELSDTEKSPKLPIQELKITKVSTNEGTFGIKQIKPMKNQSQQDNINQIMQNILSFDPMAKKQLKDDPLNANSNTNNSQPFHNQADKTYSNQTNNDNSNQNQMIKTLDNMNNVFQNQMQLSEHVSEISWQYPQSFQNNIINSAILNKRAAISPPGSTQQINQNILFNITKMKQATENALNNGVPNLNNQQSIFNDAETANFYRENSNTQNTLPKLMKNSSWLRKGSLQLLEKDERSNIQEEPQQMSEIIERPITPHQQILMKCQCRRILCVDDEIFNIQVLMLLFQKLDYKIEKAFNGKDAITIFTQFYNQKSKYHCESPNCTIFKAIILDCNMPIMNGWDCAKELRNLMNQKKLPSIPIIALTAYVAQQAYNQCIESGMDDVMNKPINMEVLRNTVENYIRLYETDQKNIQWV